MFISLVAPPASDDKVGWVKNQNKTIDILNKSQLTSIYRNRKAFFGDNDFIMFVSSVDEFIVALQAKVK